VRMASLNDFYPEAIFSAGLCANPQPTTCHLC
jgi:hypothetical protein